MSDAVRGSHSDPVGLAVALAVPFIAHEEGCRLKPYLDAVQVPTVGFGHVIPSMDYPALTYEQALALLREDVTHFAAGALKLCPTLGDEPSYRLAAVTSFAFNLGLSALAGSTLRRKLAAKDWDGAALEFPRWNKAGGHVLAGLVARRAREAMLFQGKA